MKMGKKSYAVTPANTAKQSLSSLKSGSHITEKFPIVDDSNFLGWFGTDIADLRNYTVLRIHTSLVEMDHNLIPAVFL